ncbi:MAG: hypothetical protein ACYCYF_09250 [Anaerolineae bacterium]
MLEQLNHQGVIVPDLPEPLGLFVIARGRPIDLTPEQEEMAMAWAAKKDTPYAEDPVFVRNFMQDFSRALQIEPVLGLDEVDFSLYYARVDENRSLREAISAEERKALAAERKQVREELKARYGYAIVNGQRVELGTYMVEPSGIFMGRGQHPLRGRWKQGARREDITLNYGPGRADLGDGWAEIVWQPESLWVARWKDRLTGKLKYIWLSDTAPVKQSREAGKFDQALKLDQKLGDVRSAIQAGLISDDPRRRMIATACYLIDTLCLRVGDEKEAEEADTVGATTLRPEHVTLHGDGSVEFEFLGKDSVHWHKTLELPVPVYDSLAELIEYARPSRTADGENSNAAALLPQIFPDVTSGSVNAFFSRILPGLSAKKFRTYHATKVVEHSLKASGVKAGDPEFVKWRAANLANLEAAQLCNHTKQVRGSWDDAQARYDQRIAAAQQRISAYARQITDNRALYAQLQNEAEDKESTADANAREAVQTRYKKRLDVARRRVDESLDRRKRAQEALGKIKAQMEVARRKREWNTSTSLKSYVDPRVYQRWGERVQYDVLNNFYPTALRRKYAWVQYVDEEGPDGELEIRPCLPGDLKAVAMLFQAVTGEHLAADQLREQYLPELGQDWRVALIALGAEQQVAAFAALGPLYVLDNVPLIDCFAVIRPEYRTPEVAERLADDFSRHMERFVLDNPVKRGQADYRLAPRDDAWYGLAPGLPERLGLLAVVESEAASDTQSRRAI